MDIFDNYQMLCNKLTKFISFLLPGGMKVYIVHALEGMRTTMKSPFLEQKEHGCLTIWYRLTDRLEMAKLNVYLYVGGSSFTRFLLFSAIGKLLSESLLRYWEVAINVVKLIK